MLRPLITLFKIIPTILAYMSVAWFSNFWENKSYTAEEKLLFYKFFWMSHIKTLLL